jgi:hypothetical protein
MDTGFTRADAQSDFARARRRRTLARVGAAVRRQASDVNLILPFDEVVEALGRREERDGGLRVIPLDRIVGTVDRARDFDRDFRPTSERPRERWERLAAAMRRGEPIPPISVYAVGDVFFVRDGHHRVSVARALGRGDIEARVTEVVTDVAPGGDLHVGDLPLKSHERVFFERVPLPPEAREAMTLSNPIRYGVLAEAVEAWGFREMQCRGEYLDRRDVAAAWYAQDFLPIVSSLGRAGLVADGETDAEAYLRLVTERYLLLRNHDWNDEVVEQLGGDAELSSPASGSPRSRRRRT